MGPKGIGGLGIPESGQEWVDCPPAIACANRLAFTTFTVTANSLLHFVSGAEGGSMQVSNKVS